MLLNNLEIALNEALIACQESAHRYEYLVNLLKDDSRLLSLLRHFSQQRMRHADKLKALIHESGYLPHNIDTDKETLEQWITHVKSWLAEDTQAALLKGQTELEEQLIEKLEHALEQPVDESNKILLQKLKDEVINARAQLIDWLNYR